MDFLNLCSLTENKYLDDVLLFNVVYKLIYSFLPLLPSVFYSLHIKLQEPQFQKAFAFVIAVLVVTTSQLLKKFSSR